MYRHFRIALLALSCCLPFAAGAADIVFRFRFDRTLQIPALKSMLSPDIRLVWNEKDIPEYTERAKPDDYGRSADNDDNPGMNDDAWRCASALLAVIRAVQEDALQRRFDVIYMRSDGFGGNVNADEFACKKGRRSNEVEIYADFIVSKAFAARLEANPPAEPKYVQRSSNNYLTLPMDEVLASPELKTALDPKIRMHWGKQNAPAYRQRYGPDDFRGEESSRKGREAGCRAAFVSSVKYMLEWAQERGYDGIVRIHSNLEGTPARSDSEYECRIKGSDAQVYLSATLVMLK